MTLADDGALLVRPCEHSPVRINKFAITQIETLNGPIPSKSLSDLHQSIDFLFPSDIFPADEETFKKILKATVLVLNSKAMYLSHSKHTYHNSNTSPANLVVDDSFTLFTRPFPTSAISLECMAFNQEINNMGGKSNKIPNAVYNLTHGPSANVTDAERGGSFMSFFKVSERSERAL